MMPPNTRHKTLAALPGTCQEIMARTGIAQCTVFNHLRRLLKDEHCHVSGWWHNPRGGSHQAIHSAGPGLNVPYPVAPPVAQAISQQRYKAKAQLLGIWDQRLASQKRSRLKVAARKKMWAASLFSVGKRKFF